MKTEKTQASQECSAGSQAGPAGILPGKPGDPEMQRSQPGDPEMQRSQPGDPEMQHSQPGDPGILPPESPPPQQKRGYLNQDFRFFHLKDRISDHYGYHYHDFNKIVLLLSGKVTYMVEGKSYFLKPWDILLVNHHDIHRPVIDPAAPYERIIIWASPEYIKQFSARGDDLAACFALAGERRFNLIRLDASLQGRICSLMAGLEAAVSGSEYGSSQMAEALFVELLVYLNRIQMGEPARQGEDTLKYDPRIENLLKYISSHLTEELTIDDLAAQCYVSRFYLMHRFKEETGYTIYNYIMQKRLLAAKEQMEQGVNAGEAALQCGFREYSSFLRAFKKEFGMTPKEYLTTLR